MDEVLHLRPLRHPAVEWREIGGEATLVLPGETFASHELNEVASRIWELCDGRSKRGVGRQSPSGTRRIARATIAGYSNSFGSRTV